MKLKIAVCDDEQGQIEYLQGTVAAWAKENGHTCNMAAFPSAEAFLFAYSENRDFDLLLLDVEMTGKDGITLAKELRKERCRAEIIFITSHFEFYGEGYEVDALHYLLKPVEKEKLFSVLSKAADRLAIEPPSVVVRCEGELIKLYESKIFYVEALLHYVVIHTADAEYKIKENLSAFAKQLSADFYQTHRSYYVSLKYVVRISRTTVVLEGGTELPLSRGKYDDINRAYIERN